MEIKKKITHIAKVIGNKELGKDLVRIYRSEGEAVLNSIYSLANSSIPSQAKTLINAILDTLDAEIVRKNRPEYWDLTLEDIRNKTPLSRKYPDIDEEVWHEINEPVDLGEPMLLEDWDFKNNRPKCSKEKLRENYTNYIESFEK